LTTASGASLASGAVHVLPNSGSVTPGSLVIFSYKPAGVTLSEAGVPSVEGTSFRMYVELSGVSNTIGSIQTGVAIANPTSVATTVNFELTRMDGSSIGLSGNATIPANGQTAKFLNEIFPRIPSPFAGILRISTTDTRLAVVGLRTRYNERGDFLITTTPPTDEAATASTGELDFPHVINGTGMTTQIVLFSGVAGQSSSGTVLFLSSDGNPLNIPTGPSAVGIAITPTSVAVRAGETQQFRITVTGTMNTAVRYTVNGVPAGNSAVGTISSDGFYTAPSSLPTPATVTVTAVSIADPSRPADASITITGGLRFNVTYDDSVEGAPPGFVDALNEAINFYQTMFSDPITINLQVGWGEIQGRPLSAGTLGQSSPRQQTYTYAQIRTALIADTKSDDDEIAIESLPLDDPTDGARFLMPNAEAKALRLLKGGASDLDGSVGFSSQVTWTFDPDNRSVPGAYDFIGVALHEISEVMGRIGISQTSTTFKPLDLFRYSGPNSRDFTPANGDYFSIDNGNTRINTFNGVSGGDLGDWRGDTIDAYNANASLGRAMTISDGDMTVMDVLGYDRIIPQ
jgi:hypothetical protein